ncbi:asparagine synthase (glutamine-hydrolyzing) [Flavobacterium psychrotolerans]|uniref:asparagine synthase (glutamine-hydrolyzing) n=1 Tax=Flavobacterium psychrotolerans TaxID=2169410 RepID=A0A2U1JIN6_9FLAO|nr:asparagine synthase (glutamine-hydrolyzing) [Flavobacterium psychrotolerans]PWA04864.1 asparagine synthase (glutamine-hydrolyzing) [Flavobacterium psychrotolerans]
MCGIAGLIRKSVAVEQTEIEKMTDALSHRGPDGSGFYVSGNMGIGHRRLSIIDLEGGKQPLCNEDQTIWITFNGEIYNYLELRAVLLQKGHRFKTHSDTEAIVHAYEEWGTDCVTKLRGMFAFAILDNNKKELFIARDHFGIKPLVYAVTSGIFCFASELQVLKKVKGIDWSTNLVALDQYLQFQYIPAPNTIYSQAHKLPPAHWMRVKNDGTILEIKRYWQLEFREGSVKTEAEWAEGLSEVLKESVKAHLVSDVPFGAFLSGGIDSSAVVGYMAQQMQQPVKTFSIGFKEEHYSELKYARMVAKHWKTDHHEEIVEPDALSILPQLAKHYGEPFGDSSAIPTWYVSRLARRHVTMVLTGDAADELFAGYQSYTTRWNKHLSPVPEHLPAHKKMMYPILNRLNSKKFAMRTASVNDWVRYAHYYDDASRNQLWNREISNSFSTNNRVFMEEIMEKSKAFGHFQKAQALDFNTYLPGAVLTKVDIASMMHSLETRTPFLDIKVAEYAATIPQSYNIKKINGNWEGKLLLKKDLESSFSKEFVYRPKMGFAVPITDWFGSLGSKNSEVKERLLDTQNGFSDYFNRDTLEKIANGNHAGQKWLLLFLQEWMQQQ